MKHLILFIGLLIPSVLFAQLQNNSTDAPVSSDSTSNSYQFYVKTEILNTLFRFMLVKPTYDIDIQGTVRLNEHFHFVGTYGKTTFFLVQDLPSVERPGIYQYSERSGTAYHRSSAMLRYYPFSADEDWKQLMFVEGGAFFQYYEGRTAATIYDSASLATLNEYEHFIDMYRYGPELNIGISVAQYDRSLYAKKPKVLLSPEIFIGVLYQFIDIKRDEVVNYIGEMPEEPYVESPIRLTFRMKFGIGFL